MLLLSRISKKVLIGLGAAAFVALFLLWTTSIAQAAAPADVVINELLWMGSSRNSADEWVELWNRTQAEIPLDNWVLSKKSGGSTVPMLVIPAGAVIPAQGYFLIANYAETNTNTSLAIAPDLVNTDVSLVNSDLQITLSDAAGQIIDVADDGTGTPLAGKFISGTTWHSMERNWIPGDGTLRESWHTASVAVNLQTGAELATPKAANSNRAPEIHGLTDREAALGENIPFDISESTDGDGEVLTASWIFGDGGTGEGLTPVHAYQQSGTFTVRVTVTDGETKTIATAVVTIRPTLAATAPQPTPPPTPPPTLAPVPSASSSVAPANSTPVSPPAPPVIGRIVLGLRIEEVTPDPRGPDQGNEFVELQHRGSEMLDTTSWILRSGKKSLTLPSQFLEPGDVLVLQGATLKFTLLNSGDSLFLVDPAGQIRDGVQYPKAKTGLSFSRVGQRWAWATPTPGQENELEESVPTEATTKTTSSSSTLKTTSNEQPETTAPPISPSEAREAASNAKVTVTGVVLALLDGDSLAVIGDSADSILVRLPAGILVQVGHRVEASGKKSTSRDPKILATEVRVVGVADLPGADVIALNEVDTSQLGRYVEISGEVERRTATSFRIKDETASINIRAADAAVAKGDRVTVRGIVRASGDTVRIDALAVESAPALALPSEEPAAKDSTAATAQSTAPAADTPRHMTLGSTDSAPQKKSFPLWLVYASVGIAGLAAAVWRFGIALQLQKRLTAKNSAPPGGEAVWMTQP